MKKKAAFEHETLLPQKSLCIKKHRYCSGYIKLVLQATKQCGAKIAVPRFSGTHKAIVVSPEGKMRQISFIFHHHMWNNMASGLMTIAPLKVIT